MTEGQWHRGRPARRSIDDTLMWRRHERRSNDDGTGRQLKKICGYPLRSLLTAGWRKARVDGEIYPVNDVYCCVTRYVVIEKKRWQNLVKCRSMSLNIKVTSWLKMMRCGVLRLLLCAASAVGNDRWAMCCHLWWLRTFRVVGYIQRAFTVHHGVLHGYVVVKYRISCSAGPIWGLRRWQEITVNVLRTVDRINGNNTEY